jgi:hypothetical protein
VYSKDDHIGSQFLKSIKNVLKRLADINDLRTAEFPLHLGKPSCSISRLSAHLHLLHHQVLKPPKLPNMSQSRAKFHSLAVHNSYYKAFTLQILAEEIRDSSACPSHIVRWSTITAAGLHWFGAADN